MVVYDDDDDGGDDNDIIIFTFFRLIYNLTHRRMFTSKVWTDDSRLLQESNLATREPHRAPHHVIQATASEGLGQGHYVAVRVGFKLAIFCTEGTEHHHSATTPRWFDNDDDDDGDHDDNNDDDNDDNCGDNDDDEEV